MKILKAFVLIFALVMLFGCGNAVHTVNTGTTSTNNNGTNNNGGGGNNSTARAPQGSTIYFGTQTPGDAWEIILRPDSTFTATNFTTISATFTGTYQVNANGLITFTVTTANGQSQSATVYGSQIAGNALSLLPPGGNPNPVIAFAEGSSSNFDACSTVASNHIGIGIPPANYVLSNTDPAFVKIGTQVSGSSYSFSLDIYNLDGSFYETQGNGVVFTCDKGVLSTTQKPVKAVIAESGAFAVDNGTDGGFAGVPQPANPIDLTALVTKQFLGNYYHSNNRTVMIAGASQSETNPNALAFGRFTNPGTDAFSAHGTEYTINFANATQSTPGVIQGATVNGKMAVMVANTVGGKLMILGLSTDSGSSDPIVFSLMEK